MPQEYLSGPFEFIRHRQLKPQKPHDSVVFSKVHQKEIGKAEANPLEDLKNNLRMNEVMKAFKEQREAHIANLN